MQNFSTRNRQLLSVSPDLLAVIVFYATGICSAESLPLPTSYVLLSALLIVCLLFHIHKSKIQLKQILSRLLLGFLFFQLGILQHIQSQSNPPADSHHIYNLIHNKQTATIKGVIEQYPTVINIDHDLHTRLLVNVKALYKAADRSPRIKKLGKASGLVLLTLDGLLPEDLIPGDLVLVKTDLSRVHTYSTPGSFNYKKHLAYQSIFIKGWVQSPHHLIKLHLYTISSSASFFTMLPYLPERIRKHIADFLDKTLSQPARGLYKAILIGDRNDLPVSVVNNFTAAGCLHILAISGMHMGLLAFMSIEITFWALKRSTWLLLHAPALKIAVAITFLPLFFYALIAGFNIPVLRALLMTTVFILAILFDRPGNLANHILLAALLILSWKPWAIFTATFQLSFSAVCAIGLIYPIFNRLLFQKFQTFFPTPATTTVADVYSPVAMIQKISVIFLKWLLAGFALTAFAMLGTFPLLLFHFNRFSLAAPLSNLLAEPLICFWSLVIGLTASLCLPLFPALAKILFTAGAFGLIAAERICAFFSALPYSSVWLPTPSPIEIFIFYLFLLSAVMTLQIANRPRQNFIILVFSFLFFSSAAHAITAFAKKSTGAASVTFLDVGHGSATFLQLPQSKNILIDGGGNESDRFNIGERVIGPFLWKKKISRLDAVVITHPHADHYNGLSFILARFRPRVLWINGSPENDKEYSELLDLAYQLGIITRIAEPGDVLLQSGTTRLVCLHSGPAPGSALNSGQVEFYNTNDLSMVLRLETNTRSFLFPADISAQMAEMLIKNERPLKADVLMAPHHGSSSSMSLKFIQTVAPEFIAISAGRNSPFNLPAKSFYDLHEKGIRVLSTSRDGTITFTIKNTGDRRIAVSRYQVN